MIISIETFKRCPALNYRNTADLDLAIVHPKMNTGKECSSAECARLRSRLHCVTTRRVASTRQGVRELRNFVGVEVTRLAVKMPATPYVVSYGFPSSPSIVRRATRPVAPAEFGMRLLSSTAVAARATPRLARAEIGRRSGSGRVRPKAPSPDCRAAGALQNRPTQNEYRKRVFKCAKSRPVIAPRLHCVTTRRVASTRQGVRLWSARTRPRFGPTRHVASRKAMLCHRTPRQLPQSSIPK